MTDQTEKIPCTLVPRLLPSFSSHTVQKMGRKHGRLDCMRDDVAFMLGMGNRIIAHARHLIPFNCARDRVILYHLTVLETESPH